MKIAIASGKGGAGKTSVTAALLKVWDKPTMAVDADVEAPNLHLFFKPQELHEEKIYMPVPILDTALCNACGLCRNICQYKAIIKMGKSIQIFPEMCHACGGCFLVCENNALKKGQRELGSLMYQTGSVPYLMGKSRIGEAMTPPLIKAMQKKMNAMLADTMFVNEHMDVLIDSPPGVSCPAMTVVRGSDVLLLVAESSPFGFYDFKLAHAAFNQLGIPTAVIINKAQMAGNEEGDALMLAYCKNSNLQVLGEIPFMEEVAKSYAKGMILSEISPEWEKIFRNIALKIQVFIKEHCHEYAHI